MVANSICSKTFIKSFENLLLIKLLINIMKNTQALAIRFGLLISKLLRSKQKRIVLRRNVRAVIMKLHW